MSARHLRTLSLASFIITISSRPDQDKLAQQAVWQHVRRSDSTLTTVEQNKRLTLKPQGSLVIRGVEVEDAGQYTCVDSTGEYAAIYQLDALFKERRKLVRFGRLRGEGFVHGPIDTYNAGP